MTCSSAKHPSFLQHQFAEPTTGITLRVHMAMMMSSWFGSKYHSVDPAINDTFLPMMWLEQDVHAQPQQLTQFKPMLLANRVIEIVRSYGRQVAAVAWGMAVLCGVAAAVAAGSRAGVEASKPAGGSGAESIAEHGEIEEPLLNDVADEESSVLPPVAHP
jgi:hypothetical protein